MPRPHRHAILAADELLPTFTTRHHDYDSQVASMRELRELSNGIANAYRRRDRRMQALACSGSLSREDMARATGLAKSRVDQIIRELTLADRAVKAQRALEQMRRHMPDELFQRLLQQQPELAAYDELGITPDELGILPD
jgi:hypothetical protein